ncbi:MAG TPA: hypothetical protein PKL65_08140 [Bacteroidales bacterium]|jgi:hypothetical protein|nr:hypothetical protein [Bacteroidales bacterium]HNR42185.1 hypothetical protein [Bacteroidales bacterium]HQG76783.1 hypothetical protein [Bacteroidales bacterium]
MKKVFVIFISLILIGSGIKIGIDRHYCGGELAATKLILTGKPVGCGMETADCTLPDQPVAGSRCCEDQIVFYNISGKYLPVYFRLQHPGPGNEHPVFLNMLFRQCYTNEPVSWVLPPGPAMGTDIPIAGIYILRT